ncbi:hypothetical protein GAO09_19280 [Rhizobiales bacterium RZME27]|uniref:Lipoprotein n=1 Tax=Endobacterium cereale TaxID=2663029 RepID=A0A6A8AHB4_9HYPH|nr:hypothetical protein [Endobacterium cereale]MQY48181.1 hypothetical protein [Endobacterium cereale]
MKRIAILCVAALSLASCQTSPEDTAALIKRTCSVAQDTSDALQPWIDAGVIKGKDAANVSTARAALFSEPTGLCVGQPTGTLAGALVKISSFGLTLAVALRNAKD